MQKLIETREQIQEDLCTVFDYLVDGEKELMCQIIVDNFQELIEYWRTHHDYQINYTTQF